MKRLLSSRSMQILVSAGMASCWLLFAANHIAQYSRDGDWSYLVFVASETLVAALFLLRSEAKAVSHAPIDWALAVSATFAPFFFTPSDQGLLPPARILIAGGTLLQLAGLLSLNRSFGLVAARRSLKTNGLYRLVRHPLYASYLLSYTGYILANSTVHNMLVGTVAAALLIARMGREELFLAREPDYVQYMNAVKYRVLPKIF